MLILVINSGSSSLKYQLFDSKKEKSIVTGLIEKIGDKNSSISQSFKSCKSGNDTNIKEKVKIPDHDCAFKLVVDKLTDKKFNILKNINELSAVGHRVVHGGSKFNKPTIITKEVLKTIKNYSDIAPLHNPPAIKGIEAVKNLLPQMPQVAVFDTSFHQTIPEYAYLYGIPYKYYKKYSLRRYGFHGTSHKFVSLQAAKKLKKTINNLKIITCHLGNGCSMAAVKGGKSIDTSMGFTPLEGLLMGTRSGDMDPAIVWFLMEKENLSIEQIDSLLNKESGLFGVSGISNDMREIEKVASKNKRAKLAIDIYIYKIIKYIGSYYAIMSGLDVLVFTAGVGENQTRIRKKIISGVRHILDYNKTEVMVIPTNEELMIAKETEEMLLKISKK